MRDGMAYFIAHALPGFDGYTPPATATFADVETSYWAYKEIEYCKAASIVVGYWDGYHPHGVVTRAEMAVHIARSIVDPTGETGLAGYTPPSSPTFSDVPSSYYAYKHIEYCQSQGVVSGWGDGTFRPDEPITNYVAAAWVQTAFYVPVDPCAVPVLSVATAEAGPDLTIAEGESAVLQGSVSGGLAPYTYAWLPTIGLDDPTKAQPVASPQATTTYTLTVTDSLEQEVSDSMTLTVIPHTVTVVAVADPVTVESGQSTQLSASATDGLGHAVPSWSWTDNGAGGSFWPSASAQSPSYTPASNTTGSDVVLHLSLTATCGGRSCPARSVRLGGLSCVC